MFPRLTNLFDIRGVDQNILSQISTWMVNNQRNRFYLLSELHQFISDEEFGKVQDALTVSQTTGINVNTASEDVLKSVCRSAGYTDTAAKNIVERRTAESFTAATLLTYITVNSLSNLATTLTTTSSDFKVNLFAEVGGYKRHIETIVTLTGPTYKVNYWREL
jgi:type II secretory pathway component PulK